jgi:hypothetical protein
MTNRIRQISLQNRLLNPAEAEIWVTVVPEFMTSTTELRGRLTGPRCPYATTVEVAYPLRPLARPREGLPGLTWRVVIPEPSLWDPISPFLYGGPIELWQDGQGCDVVQVQHGLRSFSFPGPRLRLNGQPITLYATERDQCTEEEARSLRRAGLNTLLVPVRKDTQSLWDLADRLGFLVLGRLSFSGEPQANADMVSRREGHPSCLGWVLDADARETLRTTAAMVGVELHQVPESLPERHPFILCDEELVPLLTTRALPKLIRLEAASPQDSRVKELLSAPAILGGVFASPF